jgi:transposase
VFSVSIRFSPVDLAGAQCSVWVHGQVAIAEDFRGEAPYRGADAGAWSQRGASAQAEGVNANQVFLWWRAYRNGELCSDGSSSALLPVVIGSDVSSAPEIASGAESAGVEAGPVQPSGAIHIELPGRAMISVERGADRILLRTILESLQRRSSYARGRGSGWQPASRTCGEAFMA